MPITRENSSAPGTVYRPITKGTALADGACRAIWCGTAGTANLVDYTGTVATNFPLVQGCNDIGCTAVNSGGTAADLWAIY